MSRTIIAKKAGYTVGIAFCIVGIALIVAVLTKIIPDMWGQPNIAQYFIDSLWVDYELFGLHLGKLLYYLVAGVVFAAAGATVLILRQERVHVAEEIPVLLECTSCKNQWRESMSKTHLESMGYPEVRALSRRRCSNCGKFTRPKIIAKETQP